MPTIGRVSGSPWVEPRNVAAPNAYTVSSCVAAAPAGVVDAPRATHVAAATSSVHRTARARAFRRSIWPRLAAMGPVPSGERRYRGRSMPARAFRPVESSLDLVALEHEVLTGWRERDVFAESLRRRRGA